MQPQYKKNYYMPKMNAIKFLINHLTKVVNGETCCPYVN
jgi:hypothetical protein